MRKIIIVFLFFPIIALAQDMRFKLEERCVSTGQMMQFKCQKFDLEFTIKQRQGNYFSLNTRSGFDEEMKVLHDDKEILLLKESVRYPGTSTLHITKRDNRFYWVQVAHLDALKAREITIESGIRVR